MTASPRSLPLSQKRVAWPARYGWLRDYAASRPEALEEYKESWNAVRYRLQGKIFALLVRAPAHGLLLNLKCDPYLSLQYRETCPGVLPGWHMNKLHWISLSLRIALPEELCRELVDVSYDLVFRGLPGKVRDQIGRR